MNHAIGCKLVAIRFFLINIFLFYYTDFFLFFFSQSFLLIQDLQGRSCGKSRDQMQVERKAHPSHLFYKRPRGVEPVLSPPSKIPSQLLCCHWCLASMSSSSLIISKSISLFFGSPSSCCGRICVYCLAITCPTEFQESW